MKSVCLLRYLNQFYQNHSGITVENNSASPMDYYWISNVTSPFPPLFPEKISL